MEANGNRGFAVVAGMPRCGTTTLHHVFDSHPNVFVPFRKETSYFTFQYARGEDWYLSLFRKRRPGQLCLDVSGNYILVEPSIERILKFDPHMRVVVSVRDPAEVAISFYRLMCNWDPDLPAFRDFLHGYTYRFAHETAHLNFADGLLSRMLDAYRAAFGDNLLIVDFRLFRNDLLEVVQAIEQFLRLPQHFTGQNLPNQRINASNRRNSRILGHFLNQERVNSFIYSHYPETSPLFPDPAARALRKQLDRLRVRKDPDTGGPQLAAEDILLARAEMERESARLMSLFTEGPMVLGSGRPLPALGQRLARRA